MGFAKLNYSFAGLREERELAAAEKMAASGDVWRTIKPEHGIGMVGDVEPLPAKPAGKSKKGY